MRRAKSTPQLMALYTDLLDYMTTLKRNLAAGDAMFSYRSSAARDRVMEDVLRRLHTASALCAAFIRRSTHLSKPNSFLTVADGVPTTPASIMVMQQYVSELEAVLSAMSQLPIVTSLGGSTGVLDAQRTAPEPLSYGLGELHDFRRHQRTYALERLHVVTATPQWDVRKVVDAIKAVSDLADPVNPFHTRNHVGSTVETTKAVTPLRDPLSQARIEVPCRGASCVHLEVFDAASFVHVAHRGVSQGAGRAEPWSLCPYCRVYLPLSALRVDPYAVEALEAFQLSESAELTADHALEWDYPQKKCRILACQLPNASAMDETEPNEQGTASKRRRVEIGGYVLYVDR